MTNLGTFRVYVERYLRSHPDIKQNMTLLVRQMAPTPQGLPLTVFPQVRRRGLRPVTVRRHPRIPVTVRKEQDS
jgi:hypothetical protein